ncbi:MAG: hypothetical protein IPK64_03160 [bacterium]|nr:hypothetical protein [bacterium]
MGTLRELWAGRLPLAETLGIWGLLRGLMLNAGCSAVALSIWLTSDRAAASAFALFIHYLPVPYNVVIAVGGWRAASQPGRSPRTRALGRAAALVMAALFMLV